MVSSSSLPFFLLLCMATAFTISVHADQMAIYWGSHMRNLNNADLRATCETKHFSHVSLAFLTNFGNGRTPRPDFGTVCDAETDGCKSLQEDINVCQQLGVKVLLSIGGLDENKYTLASAQEANQLAAQIFDVYLSGNGIDGPLGKVKLDGVDFYVNDASTHGYWDVLAVGSVAAERLLCSRSMLKLEQWNNFCAEVPVSKRGRKKGEIDFGGLLLRGARIFFAVTE
ncbi:hypothetical protein EJ110_NYTH56447 [Nymphaea thermarum]|nr:hypothetical protein EJ110_NYTH56447 [Nymphaea thermarum]